MVERSRFVAPSPVPQPAVMMATETRAAGTMRVWRWLGLSLGCDGVVIMVGTLNRLHLSEGFRPVWIHGSSNVDEKVSAGSALRHRRVRVARVETGDQARGLGFLKRLGEQEPLAEVALLIAKAVELHVELDPLSDGLHLQRLGQVERARGRSPEAAHGR